ncbi:MAG TPA: c-type cytochrome [Polyangia bacterium]|jgi:hypothetical protein
MSKSFALAVLVAAGGSLVAGGAVATETKTAEQQFKNIQVLKGMPAAQLDPAMDVMAAALGVGCAHCHVQGPPQGPWPMEKDDKQAKRTARKMITMMQKINHDFFGGDMVVTCATCHNGHVEPRSLPPMELAAKPEKHEGEAKPPALTTKQILDKWLQASGGAAAWSKIKTRVSKGTLAGFGPQAQPLEVVQSAPDHWKVTATGPRGPIVNTWTGKLGWRSFGPMVMPIEGDDAVETRREAQLAPPVTMPKLIEGLKVVADEPLPKGNAHVLAGKEGDLQVRLYFDAATGLLARVLSLAPTPVGDLPHQTDYEDYRTVDGVKLPFIDRERRGGHEFTQTYTEIKNNAPVDEKQFAMPPAPPPPAGK